MRRFILFALAAGLILPVSAQEIFRTQWLGMSVQAFSGTGSINRFSVTGPDGSGYVYLNAHSGTGSGDIIRTKWQGTAVQDFSPGRPIVGFETSGPDFEGYVTLTAVASDASKRDILRTRWLGTAVQAYSAPAGHAISGFTVSGPDAGGYVTLSAVSAPTGIEEKFDTDRQTPLVFALNPITPSPSFGQTRISYSIARPSEVTLLVYSATGQLVRTIVDESQKPGRYQFSWQGADDQGKKVGAGVYFVRLDADVNRATKKIILVD